MGLAINHYYRGVKEREEKNWFLHPFLDSSLSLKQSSRYMKPKKETLNHQIFSFMCQKLFFNPLTDFLADKLNMQVKRR